MSNREQKGAMTEFEELVNQVGCGSHYWAVEKCMNDNKRDFRFCQKELGEFRKCYNENKDKVHKQLSNAPQ